MTSSGPARGGGVVVSFGAGVNSTALLVGLYERGERPDRILFADTGGEHERTYAHAAELQTWCADVGFPDIEIVSNAGQHDSLEAECLTNKTLPSKAFGFAGCSVKWKRQPMDRALRGWREGERITRLIGIDADEQHRGQIPDTPRFLYRYPLIEWDWGRDECVEAIERAGLAVPGKSACWYCPASRKAEVLNLPCDLHARAVAMEHNAAPSLGTVKGLGRHWSWEALVSADRAQLKLFPEMRDEAACGCYDGEAPQ